MNIYFRRLWSLIRNYPVVSSCVGLLLLLVGANFHLFNQRLALARQHEDARRYGEASLPALASRTRLTAQVAVAQEAVELIDRNLVTESDLAENLGYFYKLETASRARLVQIDQLNAQIVQDNPFKAIPFALRVSGSYPQVIAFVRALETGPRLARIRTYSFARGDGKAGTLAVDLNVELLGNK